MKNAGIWRRYGSALFMLALGMISLLLHFYLGWEAFEQEEAQHESAAKMGDYVIHWGRDVFENLQSEFIQLFFQFMLIAGFFKMIKVHAYEEDVEEVKEQLTRIEKKLAQK